MCGIAGVYWGAEPRPLTASDVDRMTAVIQHRGPDSDGRRTTPFADVGFKRLSIIDLAGGDQPIANETGSVECFLNGEIYNYVSLRKDLLSRGHVFRTSSDTEVLPHLYEEFGTGMFVKLNGMFSICLIDHPKRQVILARDHFGVKQMYYAATARGAAFASEMKAVLASGMIEPEIDTAGLLPYLTLFYCPQIQTLVRGVRKLPQGSWMRLAPGCEPEVGRYYELPAEPNRVKLSAPEAAGEVRRRLWQSVELQLQADVPVGISLSGGLDSSAIAYAASERSAAGNAPLALTIHWPDTPPEEIQCSRELSQRLGMRHEIIDIPLGDLDAEMPLLGWMSDEPVADPAAYSQFCVARVARKHVKVLLSGAGGDELFGGYGSYQLSRRFAAYQSLPPIFQRGLYPLFARSWMDPQSFAAIVAYRKSRLLWHSRVNSSLNRNQEEFLRKRLPESRDPFENFRKLFDRYRKYDRTNQQMLVDLETYLPEQILPMMDRATMAASIEGRVPFLDVPLVELAFSLEAKEKMGRSSTGKQILKDAISAGVPAAILRRKKTGMPSFFGTFLARQLGLLRCVLLAPNAYIRSIVPEDWVRGMLASEAQAMANFRLLYSLLILEVWHRLFIRERIFVRPDMGMTDLFEVSGKELLASK